MAVGPKLRFEVFKRDGFTCQYCGRKTPVVILEADHIIPRAEGGADDIANLVTSCWECNRGKGKGLLDDRAPVADLHDQAITLLERELQLREYNNMKERVRKREEKDILLLLSHWDELAGGKNKVRAYPEVPSLQMFLQSIPREDIKSAMDAAVLRKGSQEAVGYLYGILHKWRKERMGEGAGK